MKKVKIMSLFLSILFLTACSKNDDPSNSSTTEPTEIAIESSTSEVLEPTTTFENGILTTPEFELKIKSSKIIKSPAEDNFGLYVEYELTNFLTSTIIPIEIAEKNLLFQQITDSSIEDLSNRYHFLDAFGDSDDVDSYNKQVKIDNDSWNQLLPSKTVTFFEAYEIIDDSKEVEISVMIDGEEFDSYTIDLNKIEKITIEQQISPDPPQENTTDKNDEHLDNDSIAQRDYWEAVEYGLSEEEIAYYLSHKWYGNSSEYDGVSYKDLNDYLSRRDFIVEEQYEEENYEDNNLEAEQFIDDFIQEHGREPSSGEIQLFWLEKNGLLE